MGSRLSPLAWGGVWAAGIVIFCLTVPLWLPEYVAATPGPEGWIMVVTMMSAGVVGMPFLFLRSRDFGFVAAVWAIVAMTALLVLCAWSGRGTEASVEETVIYSVFPAFIGLYWLYQLRQALDGWGAIEELERLRVGLARQAIDGERVRMARDLHDEVGHALAAVGLHAELARRHLDGGRTGDAMAALTQVEEAARITQRRVNRLVRGYRSRDLAAEIESSSLLLRTKGIEVATSIEETDMPGPVARTLAWVVREATTNIMRHSDATSVRIDLTLDGDVTLCITNDHPKAPVATSGGGHGLAGLRERLGDVGGHFETTFESGTFTLLARVPREALQRLSAVETCDTDTDESDRVCH